MSRVCDVTGKKPLIGNNVSHAKNRTKRRFLPNLHTHRFWVESEKRYVSLRVSGQGMRTIDKLGIDAVLADIKAREKVGISKTRSSRVRANVKNRAKSKIRAQG